LLSLEHEKLLERSNRTRKRNIGIFEDKISSYQAQGTEIRNKKIKQPKELVGQGICTIQIPKQEDGDKKKAEILFEYVLSIIIDKRSLIDERNVFIKEAQ
jgi:hypothetical protein